MNESSTQSRCPLLGFSSILGLLLFGCSSLPDRDYLQVENARLEREVEAKDREIQKTSDLLMEERRMDLERLRTKYKGQTGTKIGDTFVVHASQRSGNTFSGDLLVRSLQGDLAGYGTGESASVTEEGMSIERAKIYLFDDGRTLLHLDQDSKLVLRLDGGANIEHGGRWLIPVSN